MVRRTLVWNADERRARAPVRVVLGFLAVAVLAVVGTVTAELVAGTLWPTRSPAYVLVTSTLGLGLGAVVGVVVVARLLDRRPLADYGVALTRAWWRDAAVGVGIAVLVGALVLGVELAAGWVTVVDTVRAGPEGFVVALVASVALFVVVGLYEELVFRGVVLKNVAEGLAGYGALPAVVGAVVVSSLLFGLVHLANGGASLVSVVGIALVALTVAASYVLTGRLGLAVGFHAAWNVALGVLFGHPVSGMFPPARVLVTESVGPVAWTGGGFGPEAGLLGVLAGLAGLACVLAYVRAVEGSLRVHPDVLRPGRRHDESGRTGTVGVAPAPGTAARHR